MSACKVAACSLASNVNTLAGVSGALPSVCSGTGNVLPFNVNGGRQAGCCTPCMHAGLALALALAGGLCNGVCPGPSNADRSALLKGVPSQ